MRFHKYSDDELAALVCELEFELHDSAVWQDTESRIFTKYYLRDVRVARMERRK